MHQLPDDAVIVGTFSVLCPECEETIGLPVHAWLDIDDEGITETMTQADNDPMWEHSMLAHPEGHR